MRNLNTDEIGGGIVRRRFQMGDVVKVPGDRLTQEEARGMAVANRNAMVASGMLDLYPADIHTIQAPASDPNAPPLEVYIMPVEGGFDVVEGRRLNPEPIKKVSEAKALAQTARTPTTQQ